MRAATVAAASAVLVISLAACTSVSDVERMHAEEQAKYASDIEFAQRWEATGIFGLPVEGVMWLSVLTLFCVTALVIAGGVGLWRYRNARAEERARLARARIELEQAKVDRGRCIVCGADPIVDKTASGDAR